MKPGTKGEPFKLKLDSSFNNSYVELIIGEDIEFVKEPIRCRGGWTYSIKAISEKAHEYFKSIKNE